MVTPQSTINCAAALTERNADIQVTEYEGAAHTEVPEKAYLEDGLINWLINGLNRCCLCRIWLA